MNKYDKTLKSYIIDNVRYIVGDKWLLCRSYKPLAASFDIRARTESLYYPRGKAFLLESVQQMTGNTHVTLISEEAAKEYLNENAAGIIEENYIHLLGEPENN